MAGAKPQPAGTGFSSTGLEINVTSDIKYLSFDTLVNRLQVASLAEAVQKILDLVKASGGRPIAILRFYGHGEAGNQHVGDGGFGGRIQWDGRELHGRRNLLKLQGKFEGNAWIELRGCDVADGDLGKGLLHAVADLLQVDVMGGEGLQNDYDPLQWWNRVYQARPGQNEMVVVDTHRILMFQK